MKPVLATALVALMMAAGPAMAADPSPSPKPGQKALPIRNVTVDVQQNQMNNLDGASHVEMPPFQQAAPRQMRLQAPAPAAQEAAPAKPKAKPSASPTPHR